MSGGVRGTPVVSAAAEDDDRVASNRTLSLLARGVLDPTESEPHLLPNGFQLPFLPGLGPGLVCWRGYSQLRSALSQGVHLDGLRSLHAVCLASFLSSSKLLNN